MRKFFVKLFGKVIIAQSKILELYYNFKYRKFLSTKSVSGKTHISSYETMTLDSQEKIKIEEIIEESKSVFKDYLDNPEQVFAYIEKQGTPVIKMKNANIVLWFIREDEGFIVPQKNLRALFLSFMIKVFSNYKMDVGVKTPCMFLMRDLPFSPYTLAYQLYHWLAYSNNLAGYDEHTMKNFKNIWALDKDPRKIKTLSLEEILSLKEAIARDVEAIDMVKELAVEISGQQKASQKLKEQGDTTI